MNLCDAVNSALTDAMNLDPATIIFGEDVAFGGVFRYVLNPRRGAAGRPIPRSPDSHTGTVVQAPQVHQGPSREIWEAPSV